MIGRGFILLKRFARDIAAGPRRCVGTRLPRFRLDGRALRESEREEGVRKSSWFSVRGSSLTEGWEFRTRGIFLCWRGGRIRRRGRDFGRGGGDGGERGGGGGQGGSGGES